jgi:hypothetical protein
VALVVLAGVLVARGGRITSSHAGFFQPPPETTPTPEAVPPRASPDDGDAATADEIIAIGPVA